MTPFAEARLLVELPLFPCRSSPGRIGISINPFIMLIVVAIAAAFAVVDAARAGSPGRATPAYVTPAEMRAGSLLLKSSEQEGYVEAPRLGTDFDIVVSGPTARARVSQIFHNPSSEWVEAVYVYPLPEGGAVDTLKMVIGDRIVVGEIKERQAAKQIYDQAKAAGQKAALVEQERPNLFTNSVANIGPGETVVVQLEYQEPIRQSDGQFSLRLPVVVAPRYNPEPVVQTVDFGNGQGWGRSATDPVPDRARIEPPVLDPRLSPPVNPVTISVRLQAGFALGEVKSHHHPVTVDVVSDDARAIKLAQGATPADRDFELTWKPANSSAPSVGLFRERVGDADYVLAFVTPPPISQAGDKRAREVIFVIDNSGSMGGTSIVQAKASLIYALGRLGPSDRFNVIRFDDSMDLLFPDTLPANAETVDRAKSFVTALQARGGTEMVPPMRAALTDPSGANSPYLRQVVFLTDGSIGNEQQLLDTIADMRGRSRVFMVGIGSAPNSFLMTRASEIGRGTFTHIGSAEQVEERMRKLFEKLESPAVTNVIATFNGAEADVTPSSLPDLYRGEPLVIAARSRSLSGALEVKGLIGAQPWSVTMPLANAAEGKGLSKLWARRKIADAEVARTLRRIGTDEADKRILALALEHQLVSRLTSLVAVDKPLSRPEEAKLTRADVPLNLPAGWDFDKVFGERQLIPASERADAGHRHDAALPSGVPSGRTRLAAGQAPGALYRVAAQGIPLPKTATDAELRMTIGLLLCLLGLGLAIVMRRKRGRGMQVA